MRSKVAVIIVTTSLMTQVSMMAPASAADGYTATGRMVQLFAAANMKSQKFTELEAVEVARRFDVISANQGTFSRYVKAMKAANPDLKLLAYMNGSFAQSGQGTAFAESWYLRDAAGNKVRSTGYGNYLMNPTNFGWIDDRAKECSRLVAYTGYDGCMLDMLGTAPLDPGYATAMPINPATGKVWTKQEWLRVTGNLTGKVKAHVGNPIVAGNGLGSGPRYFDAAAPSEVLLDTTQGCIAEAWLRTAKAPINSYRPESEWKKDVDLLVDAGAKGEAALVMTKVWVTGATAQKDAWHRYALASFLLGTDGNAYFSFLRENSPTEVHPWDQVNVGSPSGRYTKKDGVYQRSFTAGMALVNPTTVTVNVPLLNVYTTLDGNKITSLKLAPNTGQVLKR
jgi:hypothetical protein